MYGLDKWLDKVVNLSFMCMNLALGIELSNKGACGVFANTGMNNLPGIPKGLCTGMTGVLLPLTEDLIRNESILCSAPADSSPSHEEQMRNIGRVIV